MYVRRGGCNVLVHRAVVRCKFSSDTNLFDAGRLMGRSKHPLGRLHKCRMQEHTNDDAVEKEVEEEVYEKEMKEEEMNKG